MRLSERRTEIIRNCSEEKNLGLGCKTVFTIGRRNHSRRVEVKGVYLSHSKPAWLISNLSKSCGVGILTNILSLFWLFLLRSRLFSDQHGELEYPWREKNFLIASLIFWLMAGKETIHLGTADKQKYLTRSLGKMQKQWDWYLRWQCRVCVGG